METLTYTLVADGSSDEALMAVIDWLIGMHRPDLRVLGEFARNVGPVGLSLEKRLPAALSLFPCDILFVHRDAEAVPLFARRNEIARIANDLHPRWVAMVPVRMTEAWLLSDPSAIRLAAGNGSGRGDLKLPAKRSWESLRDPKRVLLEALVLATEKSGRALAKFNPLRARALVARRTADFSTLRGLPAFDVFERQLVTLLKDI